MKYLYFIILLSTFTLSAQKENFIVEDNNLVWEKVFISDTIPSVETINKHIKLSIDSNNIGKGNNNKIKCDIDRIFLRYDFDFDFNFDTKEGKYKIKVYNIEFNSNMEFSLYGVTQKMDKFKFDEFCLSRKHTIKEGNAVNKVLSCMNEYLTNLFSFKKIDNNEW